MLKLTLIFLLSTVFAADRSKLLSPQDPGTALSPRLYDLETQKALPQKNGPLLPNRIYMIHPPSDEKWYFVLTDFEGKIPNPLEVFRRDSVIPGSYLGAKNQKQFYRMVLGGTWVASFLEEQHYYWILTEPPRIKVVGFGK